jgi:hypothetical protein
VNKQINRNTQNKCKAWRNREKKKKKCRQSIDKQRKEEKENRKRRNNRKEATILPFLFSNLVFAHNIYI